MLLGSIASGWFPAVRRCALSACGRAALALFVIAQLTPRASAYVVTATPTGANEGFWTAGAIALVVVGIVVAVSRSRIKSARSEAERAGELAEHREYERNVAQQELLRRLEEERELAKEKMQFESQLSEYEKYASLAQLALGAAHEINNPLLGILSHLELEWKDADEDRRVEIEQCIEGAKRISSAVRGLLDYARPGPLTLSKVNLPPAGQRDAEISRAPADVPPDRLAELRAGGPPSITADANQLSQILMNLLLNAAQATPPGGAIAVLAEKVKFAEIIELRVRDTGCGIPPDILPHVFEPFFTTKRGKGTGSGAKHHARAMCAATAERFRWKAFRTRAPPSASRCPSGRRGSSCRTPRRSLSRHGVLHPHCRRRSADAAHHRPRARGRRLSRCFLPATEKKR